MATGADFGVEEAFVGVDVAYSVEEGLVQEGRFYWGFAASEEGDEVGERDGQGFATFAGEVDFDD